MAVLGLLDRKFFSPPNHGGRHFLGNLYCHQPPRKKFAPPALVYRARTVTSILGVSGIANDVNVICHLQICHQVFHLYLYYNTDFQYIALSL